MQMSVKDIGLHLDEAFNRKMKIAKILMGDLSDQRDVRIATKWLIRVSSIKSPILEVKKNRNEFLSYIIKVLSDGILKPCLDSELNTVCDPDNSFAFLHNLVVNFFMILRKHSKNEESDEEENEKENDKKSKCKFHSRWSSDYRTYIAVKPIPGRGTILYMAVSKLPGLQNWDLPACKTI
ncbi:uncharacterized protein [Prorops nasuta]|uniref:uncharacterized protein n=1 Tax=Prorops nasuta TaxID=863751 RepID=UPI0034CF47D9